MKEYRYIRKSLAEAKPKIKRMQKALLSVRRMLILKDMFELVKITRRIYSVTKSEPKRFYQANQFYFSHLDSAVHMIEKYALLSSQLKKNVEVEQVLKKTSRTIKELKILIDNDLHHILSNDIEQLDYELDVAKFSIKMNNESLKKGRINDERKQQNPPRK
ncbi:hypothetical protein GH741_02265 [Aquibacillus halophilus]|uniref:5-bromo-4-chloroindolyl phosphate hydrolysis protein n=1 Tax=Aquibacillus halophilus TaxID=930132 RepID=A0A6A8DAC3_9BACI|nr:5-bromo-4-chloroindolyl phosphate hydrolysis family protein [Aquibacillus halophilus]MRH41496.1 hypothetical protein [Aquibacillus halophilus]